MSLCEQRDRIQHQVDLLQRRLCASNSELQQLSSDSDEESGEDTDLEAVQSVAGLLAERQKIETEIQNLENILGPHSPVNVSDDDDGDSSSDESELGLPATADSCLQMNLVYQQILEEKLKQLETLLAHNQRQQKEALSQLSGPIREASKEEPASSWAYPRHGALFLGHFLKPYFKSKDTGLGPPANQDAKERMMKMKGCLDNSKMKVKRWESWQKTLLIDSVSKDGLRRLLQPKLSRLDYLTQKLSSSDKSKDEQRQRQLRAQIEVLEKDIESIKLKKQEELVGDQNEDHDWHRIANIDFEGLRQADDLRLFWQNFLHPAINKNRWSAEEVQKLKEVSARNQETDWDRIAQELGTGRTAFMCLQTFQRFISSSLKRGVWTPAEDQKLTEMVDKMRIGNFIPYTQISYFMEGRDTPQLIYRWGSVLDPRLKKGTWSAEEDQLLLRAVARHGEKRWWKIRSEVPGRTDGACRDRYLDCLKEGTKKGAFDLDEQQLLLQLLDKHGAGRWAKIAAEIPHRNDAQCLREWKKMMRRAKGPCERKRQMPKTPQEAQTTKNAKTKLRVRIKRRLQRIKEEEEEEDSSQEDDDEVKYMDTEDEDEDEEKEESSQVNKSEEEDEEQQVEEDKEFYLVPPVDEWIPQEESVHRAQLVSLHPAPGTPAPGPTVRSTVAADFGRLAVTGPPPRRLRWEERHAGGAMLMMSQEQLRSHLRHQANKCNKLRPRRRVTDTEMDYLLQMAVLPWVGNVLLPSPATPTLGDALGEKTALSSTAVFRLLLRAMTMDVLGCKEVIVRRGCNKVTPPPQPPLPKTDWTHGAAPPCFKNPKSVAAMLYTARARPADAWPPAVARRPAPPAPPLVCLVAAPLFLPKATLAPPPLQVQSQSCCRLPLVPPRAAPASPPPPVVCLRPARPVAPALLVCPPLSASSLAPPPLDPAAPSGSVALDHDYGSPAPKAWPTGRKRGCREDSGDGSHTNVGKRIRKLSQKAQALMHERRRRGCRKSKPGKGGAVQVTSPHPSSAPSGGRGRPPRALLGPLLPAGGSSPEVGLNIDPSLVFSGSPAVVVDWLGGRGGVAVPESGVSLPYLPPCGSSLNALAAVLADKTKNARAAERLVRRSDCAAQATPEATADETVCLLRALVRERLGSNPAFRLLKARFLSVFALPALLATLRPVTAATSWRAPEAPKKKVKDAKQKAQKHDGRREFWCDGSGAPANHFSGIGAGPDQPRPTETVSNP
ncbi:snRNA-activating protein complex subunit 4 [Syngnathoides biaculeatus]|uniref:snRNA-activating protein complex subunit 4 n=1 Tax=Syngnathoides biaculeatus TaxID=300417 RepID=UPI002ADE5213|nr:snRNA-activating protein complex subunit 4 [Syngnathoides biaculeatus]